MKTKTMLMIILAFTFSVLFSSLTFAANPETEFFDQLIEQRVLVNIAMMSGEKLQGYIKNYDNNIIIVDSSGDLILYKHAVSSITSADGSFRLNQD